MDQKTGVTLLVSDKMDFKTKAIRRDTNLGDMDSYMQKYETQRPTYIYTKINSGWIKDLNISMIP